MLQGGVASVIKRRPSPATRTSRYRRRCRGRYYGATRMRGQEERRVWLVGCISALEKKTTPSSEEGERCSECHIICHATSRWNHSRPRSERRGRCEFCPRSHALPIPAHPSKYVPSHHAALVPPPSSLSTLFVTRVILQVTTLDEGNSIRPF